MVAIIELVVEGKLQPDVQVPVVVLKHDTPFQLLHVFAMLANQRQFTATECSFLDKACYFIDLRASMRKLRGHEVSTAELHQAAKDHYVEDGRSSSPTSLGHVQLYLRAVKFVGSPSDFSLVRDLDELPMESAVQRLQRLQVMPSEPAAAADAGSPSKAKKKPKPGACFLPQLSSHRF